MKKTLLFAFTITLSFLVLSCGDSNKDNSDISKKDGSSDLQKRYGIKSAVLNI